MRSGFVKINQHRFPVLLAISSEDQERGLMGVAWPPPAMAFIYEAPQFNTFWMKGTQSPLDIVFCLSGKIVKICDGEPNSTNLIRGGMSDLVIEFPHGTCHQCMISEGQKIELLNMAPENFSINNKLFDELFKIK